MEKKISVVINTYNARQRHSRNAAPLGRGLRRRLCATAGQQRVVAEAKDLAMVLQTASVTHACANSERHRRLPLVGSLVCGCAQADARNRAQHEGNVFVDWIPEKRNFLSAAGTADGQEQMERPIALPPCAQRHYVLHHRAAQIGLCSWFDGVVSYNGQRPQS